MPPRSAKKVAAKKGTPKSKQDAVAVTPSKVSPSGSSQDNNKVTETTNNTTDAVAVQQEAKQDVVVTPEKTPETKPEEDNTVVKMEVTSTTVVEETKVFEETVEVKNQEIDSEIYRNNSDEDPEEAEEEEEEEDDEDLDAGQEDEDNAAGDTVVHDEEAEAHDEEAEGKEGEEEADDSGSDDEDDVDPSAYLQLPLSDRKKPKDLEIFVGGLDKKAVEEDLTKVFAEFGEIQELRIVKHPVTQKSKGFAFLRYANVEQAKKVLNELKDGIEVKGKRVGISASQDSDTIYVGNICKTWTKEQVLEALKSFGIEQVEEIYLPDDPSNEGKIKGFAFVEFGTHAEAMNAFQRLRKPDAVLGRDRSAKVAFAQSMHPSEESLAQVKTVYVEGLADSWDEEKLNDHCKQYGEIEKILLSRNLVRTKRKDFGFVTFTSRESALACVDGVNNAQIAEGDVKVKANLAKPEYKGRLGKTTRGGYRITKGGEKTQGVGPSKTKGNIKSKGAEGKKATSNSKSARGKSKPKGSDKPQTVTAPPKSERSRQRNDRSAKGKKRDGKTLDAGNSGRPSKKPRGNTRGNLSGGYGNRVRNSRPGNARQSYGIAPRYADPYRQAYAPPPVPAYYPGSSRNYSDMEPHAGYLKPSARKQDREAYGYGPRSTGGYGGQGSSGAYGGGAPPPPTYAPTYSSYSGYSGGSYGYPSSGAYPSRQGYY